jgi:hypothetical protein
VANAYVEIPLHSRKYPGLVALVDVDDYPLVSGHRWNVIAEGRGLFYARAHIRKPDGRWTRVGMHKLITGYRITDHENRNGLDNRRSNLGSDTRREHAQRSRAQR